MTVPDLSVVLTGEYLVTANTHDLERPSRGEIARLAYELYERRGRADGDDVVDWLSAERVLRHHYSGDPTPGDETSPRVAGAPAPYGAID